MAASVEVVNAAPSILPPAPLNAIQAEVTDAAIEDIAAYLAESSKRTRVNTGARAR